MWYLILQIVFWMIFWILVESFNKHLLKKDPRTPKSNLLHPSWLIAFFISVIWPASIILSIFVSIYYKFGINVMDKLANKLSKIWE